MSRERKWKAVQGHAFGLGMAALYLVVLIGTARDVGFSRDEGFYFDAARRYQKWFDILFEHPDSAMEKGVIDTFWRQNREHPALMKTLFGFSERVFHKKLDWLSPSTSLRLPGMVSAALTVYILFIWSASVFGCMAGFAAALFFAFMPRVFYHAHQACFDMPITFMWLLVTYLYWRSLSSWKHGLAAGVAFGFALSTKLNAFFLPVLLGLHYLAIAIRNRKHKEHLPRPYAFVFGLLLAPIIFLAHWPWLYYETLDRLLGYVRFHSNHVHYNTAWFGENIVMAPTPILFPVVMTIITIPTVILVLALAGSLLRGLHHLPCRFEKRRPEYLQPVGPQSRDGLDLLLFISAVFPIALISLPSVPVFGGTKHWMPAFPFISLLAGVAVSRLGEVAVFSFRRLPQNAIRAAVLALVVAPPIQQTLSSHPLGLASYVPLVGGAPGAASLGMTRQFWGYTTANVAPWLNETFSDGARLDIHDTAGPSFRMFHEEGILDDSIRASHLSSADAALMHHELHMVRNESWIWNRFKTVAPTHVFTYQGVPIVSVYTKANMKPSLDQGGM